MPRAESLDPALERHASELEPRILQRPFAEPREHELFLGEEIGRLRPVVDLFELADQPDARFMRREMGLFPRGDIGFHFEELPIEGGWVGPARLAEKNIKRFAR